MVATMGEKIVETSLFGDQNNPLPLPFLFIQSWGVSFPRSSSKSLKKKGWGRVSFIFPFFKLAKGQKGP